MQDDFRAVPRVPEAYREIKLSDENSGHVPNLSVSIANVSNESDAQSPRRVTPDQVVAWNMAYWRRKAGLTQQQLGERIGWTNATVSEAERSWNSGRTREFNAHLMLVIATALGVPLTALLLPPEDAGAYEIALPGGTIALMEHIMPDLDADSAVLDAYRNRLARAAETYLAPDWAQAVAAWRGRAGGREELAARAAQLRRRLAVMAALHAEFSDVAQEMEDQAAKEDGQ